MVSRNRVGFFNKIVGRTHNFCTTRQCIVATFVLQFFRKSNPVKLVSSNEANIISVKHVHILVRERLW